MRDLCYIQRYKAYSSQTNLLVVKSDSLFIREEII